MIFVSNFASSFPRVSSIESKSSHPMAAALVDHGRSLSINPKPENVDDFQNFPGEGVHGRIDGKDIYIGNRKIATRANCATGWIFHVKTREFLSFLFRWREQKATTFSYHPNFWM